MDTCIVPTRWMKSDARVSLYGTNVSGFDKNVEYWRGLPPGKRTNAV